MARRGYPENHFHPCKLCTSPYRYQIEAAYKSRPRSPAWRLNEYKGKMAKKYKRKLNIKINSTFHSLVDKHMAADHQKLAVQYPYLGKPKNSPQKLPKASLGSLSQSLLDIGKDMADHYKNNPNDARKDLTFNQIFKAQDSLTKRMEVEVQQSALKLQMAKLFSGQLPEELQIEEGELVDESEESLISLLQETTD